MGENFKKLDGTVISMAMVPSRPNRSKDQSSTVMSLATVPSKRNRSLRV